MEYGKIIRLILAWMACTALIFSVACSNKKKAGTGGGVTPPAPQAPAPQPSQQSGGELDRDSSSRSQETVQTGTGVPAPRGSDNAGSPQKLQPIRVTVNPKYRDGDDVFADENDSGTVSEIESEIGTGLYFSGSGEDHLMALLKSRLDHESNSSQRETDKELASQISASTMDINWKTRRVKMSLFMEREGRSVEFIMRGTMDAGFKTRFGSLKSYPYLAAESQCMDLDGGCRTVRVKLLEDTGHGVRKAYYLIRETPASLLIKGKAPEKSRNVDYQKLMRILLRTPKHSGKLDTVTDLTLTTTEVVNGASTFMITMRLSVFDDVRGEGAEQFLAWTGPLVKPHGSSETNVLLSPMTIFPRTDRIQDSIRSTRMIRNDGRGNIQIELMMKKSHLDASEEKIKLTISRTHSPVGSSGL